VDSQAGMGDLIKVTLYKILGHACAIIVRKQENTPQQISGVLFYLLYHYIGFIFTSDQQNK